VVSRNKVIESAEVSIRLRLELTLASDSINLRDASISDRDRNLTKLKPLKSHGNVTAESILDLGQCPLVDGRFRLYLIVRRMSIPSGFV